MKYFLFRNSTVEPFFTPYQVVFSGYGDISTVPEDADAYIWFYTYPVEFQEFILIQKIKEIIAKLFLVACKIPSSKLLFVFTLPRLYSFTVENSGHAIHDTIEDFNNSIYELEEKHANVKIIDFQSFTSHYSIKEQIDWKYYYLSGMSLNPKLSGDFHKWFEIQIDVMRMKRKKCLILDLDNTLWGGILGEDGVFKIKIGGDYPGNVFLDFQKSILELQNAGVILVVCSKNNESDVLEAWEKNPNILIRKENLATYKINWKNKAENIHEIINELNIGSDSMVYLDDNPSERELVRQFFPDIIVPEFPDQPYMLPIFIQELTEKYFKVYKLTSEDFNKTNHYHDNATRKSFQSEFSDFIGYLQNLKITIEIFHADQKIIPRIAQLTQKTNQFNLTTKRYDEAGILSLIENGYLLYAINVGDRLGNSGITGLIILSVDYIAESAEIDTFLLSCRILGKDIEIAFMNYILNKLKLTGIRWVMGNYIKTQKNEQVAGFFEKLGFSLDEHDNVNSRTKTYLIDISNKTFEIPSYFSVIDNGL